MASLSRQLAQWVAGLRYEDLPAEVIDRAKGVTLHNLASVLIGSQTSAGKEAVKFVTEEESAVRNGATLLVYGTKVTKGGAAFANAEMVRSGGKLDSFRMLTHPGTSIIPGALIAAETGGVSGKEFITGVAAGYEVMERMAADVIPTVMARGFHPSPVFGIFGAAVAAAKILRMTEDQVNSVIGLCASLAASNVEGPHSGGRVLREGAAVRNAMLAVALAQRGHVGGETVLEGEAGFYHAYAGNNHGQAHLQLYRRHPDHARENHRRAGEGMDVPRDALSHLLDSRLQHRSHRRDGAALQGAQHQAPGHRAHRSRGELARDTVSQPRPFRTGEKTGPRSRDAPPTSPPMAW